MAPPIEATKEKSMILQKDMLAKQFQDLATAKDAGKKAGAGMSHRQAPWAARRRSGAGSGTASATTFGMSIVKRVPRPSRL